jgi:peptidoglycan/xylan/chitin deacetylase (PgdA/CDA1 family)
MNKNYFLNIEGYSERMTDEARERLLQWRDKALLQAKRHTGLVRLNGPDTPKVALTFDDGPDDSVTPMIAETLTRYGVRGSFFFVGSRAQKHPEVVKAVYEAGHLVLGHSYNHDRLTTLDPDGLELDFHETQAAIRCIIGKEPALFRPPFGDADETVFRAAAQAGCSTVLWSLDTLDWSQKEAAHIGRNVDSFVRNGEIILMHSHSGCIETAKALPHMIESLQRKRLSPVGLDELLDMPAYRS